MTDTLTPFPSTGAVVEQPLPLSHRRTWLLEQCTNADCHGHYRPLNGYIDDIWACPDCHTTVTHTELTTADKFGDLFTTQCGALHRGIDPATLYTYTTPGHPDRTLTFTVNDLYGHLRNDLPRGERGDAPSETNADGPHADITFGGHSNWPWETIRRMLGEANTRGTATRLPTRSPRAVITRNTP